MIKRYNVYLNTDKDKELIKYLEDNSSNNSATFKFALQMFINNMTYQSPMTANNMTSKNNESKDNEKNEELKKINEVFQCF